MLGQLSIMQKQVMCTNFCSTVLLFIIVDNNKKNDNVNDNDNDNDNNKKDNQ